MDSEVLLDAAKHPSPGLVVGRFLNGYEPLVNTEYLRKVEVMYKKRVMAEKADGAQSDYGEFSSNPIMPYEFFLFDRLHRGLSNIPEAIEGLANIYGGDHKAESMELTLRGLPRAAQLLASQGITE